MSQEDPVRRQSARASVARARSLFTMMRVPTDLPSVATFTAPALSGFVDVERNPTQAVHYWLRRDIVRGVFRPMERLKIAELVDFYKVGHSPVREAILLLTTGGLVLHEHQKGHRVAPVSLADYADLVGVYRRIYRLMLKMALDHGDDAWEEAVVVQLHRSLKVPKLFDSPEHRETWQLAYGGLHYTLLSGCGSPILMQIWTDLGNRIERYINLFADYEVDLALDHHSKHREIVDALVKRDAPRLETLVRDFFEMGTSFHQTVTNTLAGMEQPDIEDSDELVAAAPKRGRPRKK